MSEPTRSIEAEVARVFCQRRSVPVNCAVRKAAQRIEFDSIVGGQRLENVTQQAKAPLRREFRRIAPAVTVPGRVHRFAA